MIDAYSTVGNVSTAKITRDRSRFIATLFPVSNAEEVSARLAEIRRTYHDATHLCYAYRLAADPVPMTYIDDAGEPRGSAGLPILQQLEAAELLDALAVVVRYFGGVKLGLGGLVRAYGDAVATALSQASLVERRVETTLTVRFPADLTSAIMSTIHHCQAKVIEIRYDTEGHIVVGLPPSRVGEFEEGVREQSGARARVEVIR